VSSLAQDTAHALHYQHCVHQLAPLSLSELLVRRRVLLRVLAAHSGVSGTTESNHHNIGTGTSTSTIDNTYTPLTAPPALTLRIEVAACGVSMVTVAKWASYVAELHNRYVVVCVCVFTFNVCYASHHVVLLEYKSDDI